MTYAYQSHIYLAEVVLNVKDLKSQTAFYHQIIGLEILSQTETEAILGLGRKALVHLIATEKVWRSKGALWALPSGDFVADTKSFGRCLETPK